MTLGLIENWYYGTGYFELLVLSSIYNNYIIYGKDPIEIKGFQLFKCRTLKYANNCT